MRSVAIFEGSPACGTRRVTVTGASAVGLPVEGLVSSDGTEIQSGIFTVEVQAVRVAFGVDASNGAEPVGHFLEPGDSIEVHSRALARGLRMIAASPGMTAVVQWTGLV